jgi:rubrerythrin
LGASSAIAIVGLPLLRTFVEAAQQATTDDIESLNSAIELERAGIKAYADAAATGLLSAQILEVAKNFMADHVAHRDALIAAVTAGGGTPSAATAHLDYPRLASSDDVLEFAMTVERKAASTYLSVIPDFQDRQLAQVAASILGVEATHVTTLAAVLGARRSYPSGFVS